MKEIRYLVLSDIHLGHPINPTEKISLNIQLFFNRYKEVLKDIDIIFIAGDIFDRYIPSYKEEYLMATKTLTFILLFCKENNIKLRILEGTPSHDWGQAKTISTIIKELSIDIDYLYIDTLYIEKMKDLNLTILYVPDEYKHNASETLKDIHDLFKENSLTQVDIAIMHGQFHYQIPMVKLESSHDEEELTKLVKHYISIGHIHTHSSKGKILAQGSFDRLAHNEEEDKGGVLVSIKGKEDEWVFLKNSNAMLFKTYDLRDKDLDSIVQELQKIQKNLPLGSSIRFLVNDKDKFISKLKEFKKITTGYNFKVHVPDVKSISKADKLLESVTLKAFSINEDNIRELVASELDALISDEKIDLKDREPILKSLDSIIDLK